jgi:hypothetical protein
MEDEIPKVDTDEFHRLAERLVAAAKAFGMKYQLLPDGTWIVRGQHHATPPARPRIRPVRVRPAAHKFR